MGSGFENASIVWNETTGLTVCKTASKTETVQAKAGDLITGGLYLEIKILCRYPTKRAFRR